ncbi:MAG: 2-iminoacetate synthase ThiH [Candidatus Eremiobacteraeota bacterium]|nr:2-iminoacetate synthase ThiH [Candidatus Eremiobacteraeota bacterium]MBV8280658.1 2-iminoacetate synthase ThiH [Candidatus Eremiobacteraeota bacterium]
MAAAQRRAPSFEEAAALLSPAAGDRLEDLAQLAHGATIERFGNTMALYAPLYLSNECVCTCTYCGFSMGLPVKRRTLRPDEVMREARTLSERGIRNILLVSAEHPKHVNAGYVALCVREVKLAASYVGLEIAAAEEDDYRRYVEAGCDGVVLYQETYDPQAYASYHLGGPKKKYAWRLDAPQRASRAGVPHLGIGALLGLADWRFEALALAQHARWLARHCWRSQVNVSLPRVNHAEGGFEPAHRVSDRDFVHFLLFLRLVLPEAGITLSTRETPHMRDRLAPLGVTQMSAGSSTEPGGYGEPGSAGEQFELEDHRSPREVAQRLRELGFDPVFKDWDQSIAPVAPAAPAPSQGSAVAGD